MALERTLAGTRTPPSHPHQTGRSPGLPTETTPAPRPPPTSDLRL